MKKNLKKAVCAVLVLALAAGLCACGAAYAETPRKDPAEETITVTASGTVKLVPDKATVSFGVSTQEQTAEQAQSKNSEAVNKVIDVLTERGVEAKSIRTTNYNMYPQYDYSEKGEQRIIGYVVRTSMSVQDQDIDDLGKLLAACVAAGINQVDSVNFLCSGYDEAYSEALTQAFDAARAKAATLAAAAGKKLDDAVTITEGWQDTSARYGKSVQAAGYVMNEASADAMAPLSLIHI